MIDQLITLAKGQLGGQLNNAGLDSSQVEPSMNLAKDSMLDQMKSEALGGGLGNLVSMFNGKGSATTDNPFVKGMVADYAGKLIAKLGLPPQTASTVADLVIPFIMQKFMAKDTGTAENEGDLLSKLGLDKDSGFADVLGKLGGTGGLLGGLGGMFGK